MAYELTVNERKELIEPKHPALSIRTQASLLSLNRSTLYYQPKAPNTTELAYKEAIDQIHTKAPFKSWK